MRIGFVTPEYVLPGRWEGGLANYLRKTSHLLAAKGHKPHIFVLSDRDARWNEGPVSVNEVKMLVWPKRIRFHRLERVLEQYINAGRLASAVRQTDRSNHFDIIQSSSYMAPGLRLLGDKRFPLVCRISSYTPLIRSALGRQRNFSDYLSDWLEMRQVLDADAAFAPSFFMAQTYERLEGFRPEVIRTPQQEMVVNDDEELYRTHLNNKKYLLFFNTLSRVKGVDLIGQVIPKLSQEHDDLYFVFIGRDDILPGGKKMFDMVREECHGYLHRIYQWPPLPKEQLYPILSKAFGVLIPSRVDNYPNACLEAQKVGIPVVGTDQSSLEEMIEDGKTGFLARNGEPSSLYFAIKRLLELTPDQYERMYKNIDMVNQERQAEDHIERLVSLYDQTINARRHRTRD